MLQWTKQKKKIKTGDYKGLVDLVTDHVLSTSYL